jgi:hypothetical protein
MGASQRLPFNRQNRLRDPRGTRGLAPQRAQRICAVGLKFARLKRRQHMPKDIFRGDPLWYGNTVGKNSLSIYARSALADGHASGAVSRTLLPVVLRLVHLNEDAVFF